MRTIAEMLVGQVGRQYPMGHMGHESIGLLSLPVTHQILRIAECSCLTNKILAMQPLHRLLCGYGVTFGCLSRLPKFRLDCSIVFYFRVVV